MKGSLLLLLLVGLGSHAGAYAEGVPQGCTYTGQTCVQQGGTRYVDGVPVYSDCWQYQQNYTCQITPAVDTCTTMDNCNYQSQQCIAQIAGVCVKYHYDYSCPVKHCDQKPFSCGTPKFCMDGDCYNAKPTNSTGQDFGQAAAAMAAAQAAADHFNKDTMQIFQGKPMSCHKAIGDAYDCCSLDGWAEKVLKCSDDEKHLADLKRKGWTVDVGSYCSSKLKHPCTSHAYVSCTYDSLLVVDIIKQGVIGQLHHSFGDPKSTQCLGVTPDELQKIDFNKIDFSNVSQDIINNMNLPQAGQSTEDTKNKVDYLKEHEQSGGVIQ